MKFSVLGSGSSGNATLIECGEVCLLMDAGLSAKQLEIRLEGLGVNPSLLQGILLTHEHGDHVRGLKNFLKKYPTPIFASRDTARVVRELGIENAIWNTFEAGQVFRIAHLTIRSFSIPHDAVDPVGFVIENATSRFGLVSDAGFVTQSMISQLRDLSALFVEANYDLDLLEKDQKRPWSIKQRISSRHGHLSNEQVSELLHEIAHAGLSQIVFGHLSSDCNCPQKVTTRFQKQLAELGFSHTALHCATQAEATPWFEVCAPFRLV